MLCLVLFLETPDSWNFLCVVGKLRLWKTKHFQAWMSHRAWTALKTTSVGRPLRSLPLPFTRAFQSETKAMLCLEGLLMVPRVHSGRPRA